MKVKYHKFWKYSHRSTFVNTFFFTSTIACTRWVEPHHMHVATWGESKDILTYYLKKISTLMVATHTFLHGHLFDIIFVSSTPIIYFFCCCCTIYFFSRWWKWMYVIRTFSFFKCFSMYCGSQITIIYANYYLYTISILTKPKS